VFKKVSKSRLRTILFSKRKDPTRSTPGTVKLDCHSQRIHIRSTNNHKSATIEGYDNILHIRNSLNEILRISGQEILAKAIKKRKRKWIQIQLV